VKHPVTFRIADQPDRARNQRVTTKAACRTHPTLNDLIACLADSFVLELVSGMKPNSHTRPPLGSLVGRFLSAMHRYDFGRTLPMLHSAKITTAQLAVLEFVCEPRTVSIVADHLGLSRPATSQLIEKLVGGGLVRRIQGTMDRRERNVSLSAKGKALLDRIVAARAARFQSSLDVLPAAIAGKFRVILAEVVDALDEAAPRKAIRSSRIPYSASRSRKP
jgi:DNA-binding MarR family transcriptional regulator